MCIEQNLEKELTLLKVPHMIVGKIDQSNLQIYSIYRIISLDLDELTMPEEKNNHFAVSLRDPLRSQYTAHHFITNLIAPSTNP